MRHPNRARWVGALVLAAAALTGLGCKETTVSRILAEPSKYQGDEVALVGDVTESMSLLGHGAYKLDDGTGTIWVVSTQGVPRRGARVAVKGRVRDVGDVSAVVRLPQEAVGSGLVLMDAQHRAR